MVFPQKSLQLFMQSGVILERKSTISISSFKALALSDFVVTQRGTPRLKDLSISHKQALASTVEAMWANTSSIDGRDAFFHEPAQHDHVDYFQSFAKFREKELPMSLPAEKERLRSAETIGLSL